MSVCMSGERTVRGRHRPRTGADRSAEHATSRRGVLEPGHSAADLAALADFEDRMHAVRSGLAAVTAAVQLLTAPTVEPGSEMQQRLGPMLVEELQRLQRLASASDLGELDAQPIREMDLDEILRDVVLTRRLAHQDVGWEQSGLGDPGPS